MAHRVTLTGSPSTLSWPPVCAACGGVASTRLPVTRIFARDWRLPSSRSPHTFHIQSVRTLEVPFCSACAARHARDVQPVGALRSMISIFTTPFVFPVVAAVLACVTYVAPGALGPATALVAAPSSAGAAVVFFLAALGFSALVWHQTRRRRIPRPTAITGAFDFSDNLGPFLGQERRVYGMENDRFATAFSKANAPRVWDSSRGR